jgi:hypothetical protein
MEVAHPISIDIRRIEFELEGTRHGLKARQCPTDELSSRNLPL